NGPVPGYREMAETRDASSTAEKEAGTAGRPGQAPLDRTTLTHKTVGVGSRADLARRLVDVADHGAILERTQALARRIGWRVVDKTESGGRGLADYVPRMDKVIAFAARTGA